MRQCSCDSRLIQWCLWSTRCAVTAAAAAATAACVNYGIFVSCQMQQAKTPYSGGKAKSSAEYVVA